MAGEWLAIDIGLPDKPEVQELIDVTGHPVEYVVFRLYRLWSWAALHCADGTARMTLPRLARTCGGDDAFWRAVAAVGWLEIDETAATVAVPGWDRRFSQAAKARLQHADRSRAFEERHPDRKRPPPPASGAHAPDVPAPPRRRGEERREEIPPPPRACAETDPAASWATLRAAWNAAPIGNRRPWTPPDPPDEAVERLSAPGWLPDALEAIGRLAGCKYFRTPVPLPQFCGPKFVRRVLQGAYDEVNLPRPKAGGADDRPAPAGFSGDDAARFEATKRALAAKLRTEGAA
jgi:hypothetical protein